MCNVFDPLNYAFLSLISWSLLLLYGSLRKRPKGRFAILFHIVVLTKTVCQLGVFLNQYDGYISYCYIGAPSKIAIIAERLIAVSHNVEVIVVQIPLLYLIVRGRSAIWVLYVGFLLPLSTDTLLIISSLKSRCLEYFYIDHMCWFTSSLPGQRSRSLYFENWNRTVSISRSGKYLTETFEICAGERTDNELPKYLADRIACNHEEDAMFFEITGDLSNNLQFLNILLCVFALRRSKEHRPVLKLIFILLIISSPKHILYQNSLGFIIDRVFGNAKVWMITVEQWFWVTVPIFVISLIEYNKRREYHQESFNLQENVKIKNSGPVELKMHVRKPSLYVL